MSDSYVKIQGDRGALHSSGQDLASASKELAEVTHVLNKRVKHLIRDAGWSGAAADAFKQDWLVCSTASDAIIEAMANISTAMEQLASTLRSAQDELDDAKDYAKAHGIQLDAHGQALPSTSADVPEYLARVTGALEKAKRARSDAAQSFAAVVTQLAPGGKTGATLGTNDKITLADAARALYSIPAAHTAAKRGKLEKLKLDRLDMKRLHRHMPKQSKEWKNFQTERLANRKAMREIKSELTKLEKIESKWKFSGSLEIDFARLREKLHIDAQMKAMDAVPLIGTAVAVGGIYLGTKDDMEKGWGFWHSLGVEVGGTVAAVGAGIGVAALLPETTTGAGVAASVASSVVIGYGVGTYVGELCKSGHWEHNIHTHGVVSGIGHSIGDASSTWWNEDVVGMGSKVSESVAGVWNDVF
jgi:uncharacterized protein YukE